MSLADDIETSVAGLGVPDVVVISSLTDASALLGLTRRSLGATPAVLYQHESQLLHPRSPGQSREPADESASLAEWRSMLAVDEVWFNSDFHRDSYLAAVGPELLARPTDPSHLHLIGRVAEASRVVPIGVELDDIVRRRPDPDGVDSPLIVFNQRWDADKSPTTVVRALEAVAETGRAFRVALLGPRDRLVARPAIGPDLAARVVIDEATDRTTYTQTLTDADIVLSDARHEFFGVAAVEALASGCVPLFPRRANYPALVEHARPLLHDGHDLIPRLMHTIDLLRAGDADLIAASRHASNHAESYAAPRVTAVIDQLLTDLVGPVS